MIIGKYPNLRLRRTRKESWSRRLIQENTLSPNDFILPIFLIEGSNKRQPISSMPGVYRYTINRLSQIVDKAIKKKIPMVALFPKTQNVHKDELGTESLNEKNLVCRAIKEIKKRVGRGIGRGKGAIRMAENYLGLSRVVGLKIYASNLPKN